VPFLFTDTLNSKNRPALVLSSQSFNHAGHTILVMITSAYHSSWPFDIKIQDVKGCGLEKASIIRFKLFTIDNRLIKGKIGTLSTIDQRVFHKTLLQIIQDLS